MSYIANENRYKTMKYNKTSGSGLKLPALSLGMWQNFGDNDDFDNGRGIILRAFDKGVTYIDLANNYGPPIGSAESNFGKIYSRDLTSYRDQLVVSSKAGFPMWEGPYGDWGSRKYMIASCDQSLKRTGLDYFDIFYSHRHDPNTPLEETMQALDYIVRSGRALYAALSNYPPEQFTRAVEILRSLGTPCVAHQIKYSMLVREIAEPLFPIQKQHQVACVSFSPLAQGLLSDKYLSGVPQGSRASKMGTLQMNFIEQNIDKVAKLNAIAQQRGQTLAQMAISWQLNDDRVQSVLIGASSIKQLDDNIAALDNCNFSAQELSLIAQVLK